MRRDKIQAAHAAWFVAYSASEREHHPWSSPVVQRTWLDIVGAALDSYEGTGSVVDRAARAQAEHDGIDWDTLPEIDRRWYRSGAYKVLDAARPTQTDVESAARVLCRSIHRSMWPVESVPSNRMPCAMCIQTTTRMLNTLVKEDVDG